MRELQACDFCGADPVGVYEPLPDRLAADQPRVALCGDCRDTLRRVLAPLDAGGGAETADDGAETANSETESADAAADDDATDAEPTTERDATAAADPTDEAVTIDPATAAESGDDDAPVSEPGADDAADADDTAADTTARPPGYANVLRLVRNRDESLARDDLETVVSSAYDMSAAEVRRAIDAAIENGDLREADGAIRPA